MASGIISARFPEVAKLLPSCKTYEELHTFSLKEPEAFWGTLARTRLEWIEDFTSVMECDMTKGQFAWFEGGKINVSVNCVDRHYRKNPDRIALIWDKDEPGEEENVTYGQLYRLMNKMANLLKRLGVVKGDRVALYLPTCPVAVAAMLACARIGAVHSVIFAGFSAEALASRIMDAQAKVVITANEGLRGGKHIQLKKCVDTAVAQCDCVEYVIVAKHTDTPFTVGAKTINLEKALVSEEEECKPEALNSEDPLFMLYTSGSTGRPKGVVHTQAGYILYAALTHQLVFDVEDNDVFGCVADIGWITGHSYVVYGPLANGVSTLLFESTPLYPNPGRYWFTASRVKLNHFYCAPTAIRLLIKQGESWVKEHDLSSIKTLGSVGEPINVEAWHWYHDVVGNQRCTVVDTWWQTETGGICISPRPSNPGSEIKPGMPMRPLLGIQPVLVDEKGQELTGNDVQGALCMKSPWPGMARTIHGDHGRFHDTYYKLYPNLYYTGDGAYRDKEGHYHITGRMDDVINVSGHRLGTAEVEDALTQHPSVAEAAVVGFPHDIKGEGVYAYVILKSDTCEQPQERIAELKMWIKHKIAAYAVPDIIQICNGLPKTRSGKIMRRILRKIAAEETDNLGDITTLADPTVVEELLRSHQQLMTRTKQ